MASVAGHTLNTRVAISQIRTAVTSGDEHYTFARP